MTVRMIAILSLAMFLATSAVRGQPAPPQPDDTASAARPAPTTAPIENVLMPANDIGNGMPLEDVLNLIRDTVPGFNSVIERDPGTDSGYPALPAMKLKNVSIGQFLKFIQISFPARVQRIDGPAGPLYVIQVAQPSPQPQPQNVPQPMAFAPGMPGAPAEPAGDQVHVYRLTEIINALAEGENNAEGQKKAMNNTLSLIQAALDQVDGKGDTVLKVHEPTQTLVFKGSPAKMAVLEQVLSTLQPKQDTSDLAAQLRILKRTTEDNEQAYHNTLDTLRSELKEKTVEEEHLSEQNIALQAQLKGLQERLAQMEKRPDNKPKE